MFTLFALAWLVLFPMPGAPPQGAPPPLPEKPGVFAITDRGVIELEAYGERRQVSYDNTPSFAYTTDAHNRIPVVSSIRAFQVNMMGWTPRDLVLLVGRKALQRPRDDYFRLNGRAYSRGPVAFDVVTEELERAALQEAYRKLAGNKKRRPEEAEAFVVIEVTSSNGMSGRCYPVRLDIAPDPSAK